LSKTTVYNTLNLFIEKQIAVVIVIEENETRYDVDINFHGHFKCETCGCVIDVDIDPENINFESLNEFQINEHHLYFKGICKNCLEKKKI
jgi:Fe2+/Zn2+ uptake regulation proteins